MKSADNSLSALLEDYGTDALSEALKQIVPDETIIRRIIAVANGDQVLENAPTTEIVPSIPVNSDLVSCLELMADGRYIDAHEALGGLFPRKGDDDDQETPRFLEAICAVELGCPEILGEMNVSEDDDKKGSGVDAPVRDLALSLRALHVDDDPNTAYAYALCAAGRPSLPPPLAILAKNHVAKIDDILGQRSGAITVSGVAEEDDDEKEDVSFAEMKDDAEDEWTLDLKDRSGKSGALKRLLKLVGLTKIKEACVAMKEAVDLAKEREENVREMQYSAIFTGNPGTGKSTVGRLYGSLLQELDIIPAPLDKDLPPRIIETSGAKLVQGGVSDFKGNVLSLFDDEGKSDLEMGDKVFVKSKFFRGPGEVVYVDPKLGTYDVHFGDSVEIKAQRGNIISLDRVGGVLFIDDAWQLEPSKNSAGRQILDLLLSAMDQMNGRLVVIFAGMEEKLDAELFEDPRSPGLASRFRKRFHFDDFTDKELELLFRSEFKAKKANFTITGGEKYLRIAAKRLGRSRGGVGFGNARAVANFVDTASERQTKRILKHRRNLKKLAEAGEDTRGVPSMNVFEITRDDLLGRRERLRETVEQSQAWEELHSMYGLVRVKESLDQLVTMVETNAEREELELEPQHVSLNRVFLGNPGTGKTSVAKLYAEILKDLGLLSKGEVIIKNPSDFIGSALGQSEEKTAAILEKARGSVLVIDEAYGLHPSPGASKRGSLGDRADPYKSAVIDTIVGRVQGLAGEDQCVLLLGYKDEMEDLVRNANPGLQRRFQLDHAFHFDDYDDDALFRILVGQVQKRGRTVSFDAAKTAVRQRLAKDRLRPHFGNAGAVSNLVSDAVANAEHRLRKSFLGDKKEAAMDTALTAEDFYTPPPHATNPEEFIFDGLIGCDFVKAKLTEYRAIVDAARHLGRDPLEDLPLTFAFIGSPGTGKTTIARRMGWLFESLGVLPSSEVKVCSAADFSTGYVGQAARKTRDIFESARGSVLFIDEAYRLWDPHGRSYFQEATDEIVSMLTEDDFKGKMVVIFAGYQKPMRDMLDNVNPGLKSRISEIIEFPDFDAKASSDLAVLKLKNRRLDVPSTVEKRLPVLAERLVETPSYANGRDVDSWVKRISAECAKRGHPTSVDLVSLDAATTAFLQHSGEEDIKLPDHDNDDPKPPRPRGAGRRFDRSRFDKSGVYDASAFDPRARSSSSGGGGGGGTRFASAGPVTAPQYKIDLDFKVDKAKEKEEIPKGPAGLGGGGSVGALLEEAVVTLGYDASVDKRTLLKDALEAGKLPEDIIAYVKSKAKPMPHADLVARLNAYVPSLLIAITAKLLYDNQRAIDLAKMSKKDRDDANDKEAAIQSRLKEMGKCPAGFSWYKQGNGWRCGGGSHWVADDDPLLFA